MNEQIIVAHAHNGFLALQIRDESANLDFLEVEPLREFHDRGSSKTGHFVGLSDGRELPVFRIRRRHRVVDRDRLVVGFDFSTRVQECQSQSRTPPN